MSDIVERLKEPEIHCPGNFDTPKHANAMLSCLCQEAAEEIESLRQQLEMAEACLAGDNALIVGLKNDIAEKDAEIERLKGECLSLAIESTPGIQLAASQAREQQLLNILGDAKPLVMDWCNENGGAGLAVFTSIREALTTKYDTTAIEAMIAKAGDVALKRAIAAASAINPIYGSGAAIDAISTVPPITLKDLE